ncbi:MAG: hypothetical protein HZB39_14365 [Planctomycetes bacterium]|nr:hypothetical protein [Planctomycetota bacterium]
MRRLAILALLVLPACDGAPGDVTPPELLWVDALATLEKGSLIDAEVALEKAVARGGPAWRPLRDFIAGNAAFARCMRAEAQARGPEAEPFAFDVAIAHAEAAREQWSRASASRDDWPEARRNLERVAAKLEGLRRERQSAIEKQRRQRMAEAPRSPTGETEEPAGGERTTEAADPSAAQSVDLASTQVDELLKRLARIEDEKRGLRRTTRAAASRDVEKDW